ncbi:MAG: PAS domain S-box protein [Acidobacteriia bacterium]|nr:PAS domain S-box protein [Terriglobia bacterium]
MPTCCEKRRSPSRCKALAAFLPLFVSLLVTPLETMAQQGPLPRKPLPVLTRIDQIRNLSPDEAGLGYPVQLRAVVTFYGGMGWEFFVQDSTGGIYVDDPETDFRVRAGDQVEVEGFTSAGGFAPEIIRARVTALGRGTMPKPLRATLEELASGREDSQWVEIEGIVRSASKQEYEPALNLAVGTGRLKVCFPGDSGESLSQLVDARVLVRGAAGGIFNQNKQLLGVQLYTPSLAFIRILEAPVHDPFLLPNRPIRTLMGFVPKGESGHRVRVEGSVTLFWPGQALFIEDGSGGLYIQPNQTTPLAPGDRVAAVGFPSASKYTPILQDAVVRKLGSGPPQQPAEISAAQALSGDYDAQLVRLKARLLSITARGRAPDLIFQSGQSVFNVLLPASDSKGNSRKLVPGSLLQLTGICSVETDDNRMPVSFDLLSRGPHDLVLLERPPWWALKHALWALMAAAALISAGALWVLMLRRRVREDTAIIREWARREAAVKERYRELFENARDMVFTCGLRGHITSFNKAACDITGYDVSKVIGMEFLDVVVPEDASRAERFFETEGDRQGSNTCEVQILRADGRRITLEMSTRLIYSEGAPLGWQGIARDVTERKRAAEALLKTNDTLRAVIEASPVAIVALASDGTVLKWNPAAERIFGWTEEEVLGRFLPTVPEDKHDEFKTLRERVLAGIPVNDVQLRRLRKDGSVVDISVSTSAIHDAKGKAMAIVAVMEDITERKRAEEQLRKLSQAVEQSPACVVITDAQGSIEYVNPRFTELSGYSRDEAMGKKPSILKSGQTPPQTYRHLWETITSGREWRGEFRNKTKSGKLYWESAIISPVRNEQGEITHFLGVKENITERKRAEQELRKAKEAAEVANCAKSEFLANMSHEIRTPMNGIIGMTELALDTDLNPEQREYMEMVRASADSLLTLINDILDFSKIEAGKFSLDVTEFELIDHLDSTLKSLAPRAHQKGLEMTYTVAPEVPRGLLGDPTRLRQILVNLIGNAVKFTERGEIAVSVEMQSILDNQAVLHFSVADTGIGIPPDKQQLIFQAFSQADSSTTRKYGGTGLGLAITSHLVGLMGGRIWVESEIGRGSTFHFTAHFGLQNVATAPSPGVGAVDLTSMPVLVVDDNPTNRRILDSMLRHWNMKPTLADGGAQGLELMAEHKRAGEPIPLVLIDAMMPEMDGFTLAQKIKQDPALAGATIMMLTSAGQRGDAARCRELGIGAYLIKPIRQSELLDAILMTLGKPAQGKPRPGLVTRHSLRQTRRRLHILLAEDNLVNRELAVRLLEKSGHTVVTAGNGENAVELLEDPARQEFDLVLMDVQMPVMDGLQATRMIREKEGASGKHLPIIAMTAHALKGDRERCLEAGMDGYIAKPISRTKLFDAIEALVPSPPSGRDGQPRPIQSPMVLDKTALLSRVDGDTQLLREIVDLFKIECPKIMGEVRSALERRDTKALESAAHALKGSVGNFCANGAVEIARNLESAARAEDLAGAELVFETLVDEVAGLQVALSKFGQ